MDSRDDCSSSLLSGLLRTSPLIVHGTAKPSFLSEPSCHSAPVTSYSSNIPGLLPPQDPCSFCPLFLECSFPRNLHWRLLDLLQAFAQMSSANEVFSHPVWNKIAQSPPTSDIPYTPPLHILTTFFFLKCHSIFIFCLKKHKCLSTHEWVNKLWYNPYNRTLCSNTKRKLLIQATTLINFRIIYAEWRKVFIKTLYCMSSIQKNIYCMILFI